MAAVPQRNNDNLYEDGGGYGKFRKRPFRRVPTTPYDRPSTSIRNPSHGSNVNNSNSNGWLSKIVDPAQRLIAYSAHKLFASVFRKRLPQPPPPPPPETAETNGESSDKQVEAVYKDPLGSREPAKNGTDYPDSTSDGGGLAELELILRQKIFTRSEIDRLTAVLHSRNVDQSNENDDKKNKLFSSKVVKSDDGKEELPNTPMNNNGFDSHHVSAPVVGSSVLDEDVASPAELAKAYMGNRPSKISPSVLGLRSQPVGKNGVTQIDGPFASKSPIMSVVPRVSSHLVPIENRITTPRSRGRSAIYSMARTPYSRVHSASTCQGAGTDIDAFTAPSSSSQSIWESGRYSGSKQGALKRRSSVLDSDIGSVGPIRRIRQKSNLLASSGTIPGRGTGFGCDVVDNLPSSQRQILAREPLIGNGDDDIRASGTVPSKSSEMASKILQQLDVLVSSRDKSPTKLSPSMLRGPALRSLENVDSSKFLETVQNDTNKLDVEYDRSLPHTRDSVSQKQVNVEENGPVKLASFHDKSASVLHDANLTSSVKNIASDVKTVSFEMNSVVQAPPQKKRAFQMSAPEDYVELDDDDHSDRIASAALSEEKENLNTNMADNKTSSAAGNTLEKPSQPKAHASFMLSQTPQRASDGFAAAERSSLFADPAAPSPDVSTQQSLEEKQPTVRSDKASSPNISNTAPLFSSSDKVFSSREINGFSPSNVIFKGEDSAPQLTFASTSQVMTDSMSIKSGSSLDHKLEGSTCFAFGAVDATKSLIKESESYKGSDKNNLKADVVSSSTEIVSSSVSTSSTTASVFSFGLPKNASSVNGSLASTVSFPSPNAPLASQDISSQHTSNNIAANTCSNATVIIGTAANINSSSNIPSPSSAPSFLTVPTFKFSSPVVPSSMLSVAAAGVESTEVKGNEASFSNLTSVPFGVASSSATGTGGSLFSSSSSAIKSSASSIFNGTASVVSSSGLSSAITNTGGGAFNFNAGSSTSAVTANQSQAINPFSAANAQTSAAGSVFSTSTQSMPIKFGSTASSPFGFTANATFSSGSSLFSSSSSTSNLFSSGATFGLTASTSEVNPVSSTTTSPVFGSNWPTTKFPAFGSASNSTSSSAGFVFGASSASNVASTTPVMFGSSASASSSSVFNFGSAASAPQLQPAFANSIPVPTFGSSPSGNSDQMNLEESMAEDTVQTSTVPVFGQQSIVPSSSFIFGSTAGGNQFASTPTVLPAPNPFQFGSQPNLAAPQNQPPFQASGSLEFNAGGSFSLGTSGGDKSTRKFVRVNRKNQRKK